MLPDPSDPRVYDPPTSDPRDEFEETESALDNSYVDTVTGRFVGIEMEADDPETVLLTMEVKLAEGRRIGRLLYGHAVMTVDAG